MDIDWKTLYQQMRDNECDVAWPSLRAKAALEIILGEKLLRQAVDDYVIDRNNTPLVRDILWFLKPWSAMQRCYEIYQSDADMEHRRAAVFLLISAADYRALRFVESLLADPDTEMQKEGSVLLDRLFDRSELAPDGIILAKQNVWYAWERCMRMKMYANEWSSFAEQWTTAVPSHEY